MYTIKGSWVGQTFALATASDSVGRKSRIRRSKEERKSMVETFIKRYQSSNNGNFPSLNLTHKEVGGSFYTVREIVREVIQENRVLGPARFSPELLGNDDAAIQYPLESTTSEFQGPPFHSKNEQYGGFNHDEKRIMELTMDTKEHCINHHDIETFPCGSEDETDDVGKYLDGRACDGSSSKEVISSESEDNYISDVLLNSSGEHCFDETETSIVGVTGVDQNNRLFDGTDKMQAADSPVSRSLTADEGLASNGAYEAPVRLSTEEVVVETFPLRTENNEADDLNRLSTDSENLNGTLNEFEMKPVGSTNVRPHLDLISSNVNSINHATTEGTNGSQSSVSGRSPDIESNHMHLNGELVQHHEGNQIIEASDFTEAPEIIEGTSMLRENMDHVSSHSAITSMTDEQPNRQSKNASNGMTYTEDRSNDRNDKEPPSLAVSENNNKKADKVVAASSPPVDRINLQSWERAASKRQPNPLLAIIKAFADALIKFWS